MKNKKLGFAKKDLKSGDSIIVELGEDELLHSEEINCFESVTIEDFIRWEQDLQ